jgi:hypothetical protein
MSFRHAPVLEANLINYLWPLCIILFTPCCCRVIPLSLHHLLAGALGLAGSVLVMVDGHLQLQQAHLPGYLLALGAAIVWGAYSVLSRRLPPAPAVVTAAACLPAGLLALLLAWMLEGPAIRRIPGRLAHRRARPRPHGGGLRHLVSGAGAGIRAASARSPPSLLAEHCCWSGSTARHSPRAICWRGAHHGRRPARPAGEKPSQRELARPLS